MFLHNSDIINSFCVFVPYWQRIRQSNYLTHLETWRRISIIFFNLKMICIIGVKFKVCQSFFTLVLLIVQKSKLIGNNLNERSGEDIMGQLDGKRILMFVDYLYEDLELWYPRLRLIEEGAQVIVAGPAAKKIYEGKNGYPCKSDAAIKDMKARDFDGLVIPGGFAPDKLRRDPKVLELTRKIHQAGKLIAHICHAGWIPISAGIMKGYKCTSTPGIKDDLINAGAFWMDEAVIIDRNMVSSRKPDDLPRFCQGIINVLKSQE